MLPPFETKSNKPMQLGQRGIIHRGKKKKEKKYDLITRETVVEWGVTTSKTPCLAMNERARKRSVSLFLVWLQCQDSTVSESTKLQTHVRMCGHPTSDSCKSLTIGSPDTHQILAQLATRILRHGDGGARAHVQRCPTPPLTCGKHVLSDAQPTYQI